MYTMDFDVEDGILFIKVAGIINSFEVAVQKANEIVDKALETGAYRVLLDESELSIDVDVLDIAQVVTSLEGRDLPYFEGKAACLFKPEYADIYNIYESFYQNKGFRYRLFSDIEAALEWLRE